MNIYGNIWSYFDNLAPIKPQQFQNFLNQAGLGKHKNRINKDFETLSSHRGYVMLSDLAEHYLDSFTLFKQAALNTQTAMDKIKAIRKMLLKEVPKDDLALLFLRSFLGVIQTDIVDTLGHLERINTIIAKNQTKNPTNSQTMLQGFNLNEHNPHEDPQSNLDEDTILIEEDTLNKSEITDLNEQSQNGLKAEMTNMKKKLSQISKDKNSNKKVSSEIIESLEQRLQENQLQLLNEESSNTIITNYPIDNSQMDNPKYQLNLKDNSNLDNTDINNSVHTDNLTSQNNNEFNINGGFNVHVDSNKQATKAWPKERMLQSVCSKMFKEGKITNQQKGQQKYMVLDNNERLISCLNNYIENGNKGQQHEDILQIQNEHEFEESLEDSIA